MLIAIFFLPQISNAFSSDKILNNQAPSATIYASFFDQLVMDITLTPPNGQSDVLNVFTLQNQGNAKEQIDIYKFTLWQDQGPIGFDGMGVDKKIGDFSFFTDNYSWYIRDLNIQVPQDGLRLFVSLEAATSVTDFYWLKMKIPTMTDYNNNGAYDLGDLGLFFASGDHGPKDLFVVNGFTQILRHRTLDSSSPKANITLPINGELITKQSYLVKGLVRDQGGSNPVWLMIGIRKDGGEENWYDATLKEANGKEWSWEYNWQNIANGDYELRTKSADFLYGNGISGQLVQVKVDDFGQQQDNSGSQATTTTTDNTSNTGGNNLNSDNTGNADNSGSTTTGAMTLEQLQARIQELNKLLDQLQAQLKGESSNTGANTGNQAGNTNQNQNSFSFQINLKLGDRNDDVKKMQEILIAQGLMASGLNTGYFGPLTKQAVIKFQEKYASEILSPFGLVAGTGFVGQSTRAKLSSLSN